MSERWWVCAVPWGSVLLATELGWTVAWTTEHGAWMELAEANLDAPPARVAAVRVA